MLRATTSNKTVITQFLLDAEVELKGYQAEINRLQARIYALNSQKRHSKSTMDLCQSLLSPIYRMPPEILEMVFAFACEKNDLKPSVPPPAVQLSMVCGRWREIVLSSPNFWSTISINFTEWKWSSYSALTAITRFFVQQSNPSLLQVSLTFPQHEIDPGALPSLINLTQQSTRWQRLSLEFHDPFFPVFVLRGIRSHLPALESLRVIRRSYEASSQTLSFDFFDACPSLHTLDISPEILPNPRNSVGPPPLPLEQIKTLRLDSSYNLAALVLTSHCHNLERIEFDEVGGSCVPWPDYEGHIVSNSVRLLAIRAVNQTEVNDVLRHSTLSGLTSLAISGVGYSMGNWVWDNTILEDFSLRSSFHLTHLHLRYLPITDLHLLSLLANLPSLTHLSVQELPKATTNRIVTKLFLNSLAMAPPAIHSSSPYLPSLTEMNLHIHDNDMDAQVFVDLVTSRSHLVAEHEQEVGRAFLQSVSIVVLTEKPERRPLDSLCCFRDTGVRVSLTYRCPSNLEAVEVSWCT
ncbi:hypothetical protein PQX77_007030 [Marasmius sp. AFHP31]|nr:hypothetical protein PQX77_007030 [Marasmius sp. AFHP31]